MQDYITADGYARNISVTDGTLIDGFFRKNFEQPEQLLLRCTPLLHKGHALVW